jgi:hypothetical protein
MIYRYGVNVPGPRRAHRNGGWRYLLAFPLAIANERSVIPGG